MKKFIQFHFAFNMYQKLIGGSAYLHNYAKSFINPYIQDNTELNMLDLGCGTGNLLPFLKKNINYTGVDYSQDYINYAKKKFPSRKFICSSVTDELNLDTHYDFIVCEAVITNLDDEKSAQTFENIKKYAKPDCHIIISDTNFGKNSTKFENFLYTHERGKYLRTKEQLTALISKHFKINNISEIDRAYRLIPYKKIVFECSLM